jgi:DNA-directed RNA polymerase specialized sigma24 family protein
MSSDAPGSVTRWIGELKAGEDAAARNLWARYFDRLVRLARARLRAIGPRRAEADEEDAALSAFHSLCAGAARGHFPELNDRDDLWRLLVVVTARKAREQVRRAHRQKRGGGHVFGEADLIGSVPGDRDAGLDRFLGREPTPEFASMVAEEYQRRLDGLGDDSLRQVALRRMEGYTSDEIAAQLGCARRTVARRLDLIRKIWIADNP